LSDDIIQTAKVAAELEPALEEFGEATDVFEPVRELSR
jgi:hypothetical protein